MQSINYYMFKVDVLALTSESRVKNIKTTNVLIAEMPSLQGVFLGNSPGFS